MLGAQTTNKIHAAVYETFKASGDYDFIQPLLMDITARYSAHILRSRYFALMR